MGQIFSWFRGSSNSPALQDVAVEQQSQAKQPTPTPAVPVSTVKPAEYEKGAAASSSTAGSTAKPAAATTAASTPPTSTAATVSAGGSTGAKVTGGIYAGVAQSDSPKTPSITPEKTPSVSTGSGVAGVGAGKPTSEPVKPKDTSKDKAQSTSISSSKPEPSKVTTIGAGGIGKREDAKPKEAKVQVEVAPPAAKTSAPATAVDPFDALAGSLPSSEPLAPKPPKYTGPEVKESGLTSEEAKRCGEREPTLPPGYRREDMEKKAPAGVPEKPKEVAKPLTEEDLVDSLSAGFVSSAAPSAPKSQAIHAEVSPPAAKASVPATAVDPLDALAGSLPSSQPVAPKPPKYTGPEVIEPLITSEVGKHCGEHDFTQPPGYRNEDMEKKAPAGKPEKPKEVSKPFTGDEAAGFGSSTSPSAPEAQVKVETAAVAKSSHAPPPSSQKRQEVSAPKIVSPAPPADKKAKVEKDDLMSLDALSALSDSLPAAKPVLEPPKLRPEDIVKEKEAKSEKGVRVGEREDSLPPDYRFPKDKVQDKPAPPKEPSMDSGDALDILSGDFTSPSVAPAVKASVPPSAPAKQPKVEELSALDALAGDFVAPTQAKKVASGAPPAPPAGKKGTPGPTPDKGEPMSLDALSALEDLLPAAKPVPESPKLRPEDIVDEKKLTSEKGVRVGEREDTLPPEYRFAKEDHKKHPAPAKREPSLDSSGALDILSGDFTSPSVAPAVKAPVPPSAPPADSSADFALEELAGDFVAPISASKVHSAVTGPPKTDRQLSEGTTSAMDALSDTLMDITPVPEPKPVSPKDIVKEKKVVEERVTKAGERDDSLPPDFRPTEADIKAAAEAKAVAKKPKQVSMDESAALDALSGDFSSSSTAAPVAPSHAPHSTPAKTQSSSQASGPVLDKLASTLLPELPGNDTKPKDSKPKKPAVDDVPAMGELPGKQSTDVVSSSPTKKGGKS